jgi:hypothetical protein
MKATLIIDSPGPNPDFCPPRREQFATDEEFHDARALYDVPAEITVPAGTVLQGDPLVWVHCFPDASGLVIGSDGNPRRVAPGIVRAEPLDDGCKAALARHVEHAARVRKVRQDHILREIEACVAKSKEQQQRNVVARATREEASTAGTGAKQERRSP